MEDGDIPKRVYENRIYHTRMVLQDAPGTGNGSIWMAKAPRGRKSRPIPGELGRDHYALECKAIHPREKQTTISSGTITSRRRKRTNKPQ
ncbi:unnamed protein product [Nezara viridula]|uniref:Uncharacterized protein n=1 Tax=Nezara viridula TaxID=85310 RepID=A0A9P0MM23_NEZVI|nr:unnamed protein product [Nezara viridula]